LLSHLPYLAQTLQKGGLSHETIFQQYRSAQEGSGAPTQGPGSVLMTSVSRSSPGPPGSGKQAVPLPAHQRVATPPPGTVIHIKRGPSPAHMNVSESKGMTGHMPPQSAQAVNLVKPHGDQQVKTSILIVWGNK